MILFEVGVIVGEALVGFVALVTIRRRRRRTVRPWPTSSAAPLSHVRTIPRERP